MSDSSEKPLLWKWICDKIIVEMETMGIDYQRRKAEEAASDRRNYV